MDAEDRRLLSETHAQSAATAKVMEQFILWSQEAHKKRDEEMQKVCARLEDHHFYIRILKYVVTPLTPVGAMGAVFQFAQWAMAHAR